jgi:hypothetical protein
MRVQRRTRAAVENSFPAVQHLTKPLFLSKPVEPLLKTIDREHTARAAVCAKTVKLADLIDNCRDIRDRDPKFARVFLAEAKMLLEVLGDGDRTLFQRAQREINEGLLHLG